ncbi:hypothetical protein [Nakamurella aerolata]|uniref:Uncharacterized protein n=1 Tax=Nakamurella aerolata TaxID=1656892 RepID=A0A849ACL5_9ACTN|nr:hypothetical protein [Nakamurella aerolata]NNG36921.1 hypothetical protein [Nakamurella aerolata]
MRTYSDPDHSQPMHPDVCPCSQRVDHPRLHRWRFDGDDHYVICVYCDQMRDAMSGRIIRAGGAS